MAFDGAFLHTLLSEINAAAFSRVEKIYEPSRDELLIHLKSKDFSDMNLDDNYRGEVVVVNLYKLI